MAKILFLDSTCPAPYDRDTLYSRAQGGTESTVTRIAEGLAQRGHQVEVSQHVRNEPFTSRYVTETTSGHVLYTDKPSMKRPDMVVGLRNPRLAEAIDKYPDAVKVLWAHDYNLVDYVRMYEEYLHGREIKIVCVSRTHKMLMADALLSQLGDKLTLSLLGDKPGLTVSHIYNPIDALFKPLGLKRNPKALLYCSSPHKGLKRTLEAFEAIKQKDPEYTLTICNPGYMELPKGVTGVQVTPAKLAELMNTHGVLFHMNAYPETFGLVYGEAIACELPILTGRAGSAVNEIVTENDYFVDINSNDDIIRRLDKWQTHQANTQKLSPHLYLSQVLLQWEQLLSK